MKDERATAFAEKGRVDKEIRRILADKDRIIKENAERERAIYAEKERVDAESLKCVLLVAVCPFFFFFFLTD